MHNKHTLTESLDI